MSSNEHVDLILGTAGHIDHGKSSLVLALTGVDPDRLVEEKRRGITIELGFAHLALASGIVLGIVDVPGHERFVRQMIAGSTGIDIALLCIAADDGIMPQTEEHLAVLELLGIPSCVVALTKTDLVDEEWVELITEEVRARLANTPYAEAPIVGVSSRSGQGLDELKEVLDQIAQATSHAKGGSLLRLPVDRVFTIHGAGTVVTGTLWSGKVAPDDKVEVLPTMQQVKVRGIQVHDQPVEYAKAGQRVALNLSTLSSSDIRPGDFISAPGAIRPTLRFDADLTYLDVASHHAKSFENGTRVHIAHGAREVTARVFFLGERTELEANQRAFAQIRLDEPLPVQWRDRFVMRSYSPMHVIGGGTVLRAQTRHTTRIAQADFDLLEVLRSDDEALVVRTVWQMASLPLTETDIAALSGIDEKHVIEELTSLVDAGIAQCLEGRRHSVYYVTKPALQKHCTALVNGLLKLHAEQPQATGFAKEIIRQRCLPKADVECFDALLSYVVGQGLLVVDGGQVSHAKAGAGARQAEQQAMDRLYAQLTQASVKPPTISNLISICGLDTSLAYRALGLLEKQGQVRKVDSDCYCDTVALDIAESNVRNRLASGPATVAELRDAIGTNRDCAIMFLEYFDSQGITRRENDKRVLKE